MKQRVANEKKKQNKKKRKAENHHKYIMGGIIVKHFPDCYHYDEGELNRILSVALQTGLPYGTLLNCQRKGRNHSLQECEKRHSTMNGVMNLQRKS